ncbi:MAG TPA: serine protease [Planctomycetota bacterium]|nr:serine protease [Planctomycetota bacterium]
MDRIIRAGGDARERAGSDRAAFGVLRARRAPWTALLRPELLLVATALGTGCGSPGTLVPHGEFVEVVPSNGHVIGPAEYVMAGQRHLAVYLSEFAAGERERLLELVDRLGPRCVRVELAHDLRGPSFAADVGSGILLGGGPLVLTAGHLVPSEPRIPLRVVLTDGRSYAARWVTSGEAGTRPRGDWALLELSGFEDPLPAMEVGALPRGELGILLGYPGGNLGLDRQGHAGYGPGYGQSARSLSPIAMVLRGLSESRLWFEPVAGVLPTEGMSGGPIVDLSGRLVGVLSQIHTTQERGGVCYAIGGGPATDAVRRSATRATEHR